MVQFDSPATLGLIPEGNAETLPALPRALVEAFWSVVCPINLSPSHATSLVGHFAHGSFTS